MNTLSKFIKDESGATMVEYAMLVSFIAVISVLSFPTLKANILGAMSRVSFMKDGWF